MRRLPALRRRRRASARLGRRPGQGVRDDAEQVVQVEGLGDEGHAGEANRSVARAQQDHRDAPQPKPGSERDAAKAGHRHVGDHQVRGAPLDLGQRVHAIAGAADLVARVVKQLREQRTELALVVHDQNRTCHVPVPRPACGAATRAPARPALASSCASGEPPVATATSAESRPGPGVEGHATVPTDLAAPVLPPTGRPPASPGNGC